MAHLRVRYRNSNEYARMGIYECSRYMIAIEGRTRPTQINQPPLVRKPNGNEKSNLEADICVNLVSIDETAMCLDIRKHEKSYESGRFQEQQL